jgi:hypothetical protein
MTSKNNEICSFTCYLPFYLDFAIQKRLSFRAATQVFADGSKLRKLDYSAITDGCIAPAALPLKHPFHPLPQREHVGGRRRISAIYQVKCGGLAAALGGRRPPG